MAVKENLNPENTDKSQCKETSCSKISTVHAKKVAAKNAQSITNYSSVTETQQKK